MIAELTESGELLEWSSRFDPSEHRVCGLKSAIHLISGQEVSVPMLAYPVGSATKISRFIQIANGLFGLLRTIGKDRVVITGETIAWRAGEVEYSTDPISKHWRGLSKLMQPLLVVQGTAPARSIAAAIGCDPQPTPRLYVSQANCTLVIMAEWGGTPTVLHYSCCNRSAADIGFQVSGLEIAATDPELIPFLPRMLVHKTLPNGASLSVQTRIPADSLQFSWRRVDAANELWFSRMLCGNGPTANRLAERLELVSAYSSSHKLLLTPLADALLEWYRSVRLPGGVTHGDFTLGNVLFKGDKVTGIIDWDHARMDGIPLVDSLFMVMKSYSGHRRMPEGELFRQLWTGEIQDGSVAKRIDRVGRALGMDNDDLKFLGLLLWFDFLFDRARECSWQPASWIEDMVGQTVPVIMRWLDRRGLKA